MRAEDDPLALFRRRPDFPLRCGAGAHEVRAGETAGPAEELDVFFLYLRAVPHPERTAGAAAEEELIAVVWSALAQRRRQEGEKAR